MKIFRKWRLHKPRKYTNLKNLYKFEKKKFQMQNTSSKSTDFSTISLHQMPVLTDIGTNTQTTAFHVSQLFHPPAENILLNKSKDWIDLHILAFAALNYKNKHNMNRNEQNHQKNEDSEY